MRPVDIGIDAARTLKRAGVGRVCAVFARALYLRTPGGLVVLTTTQAPRGPLHIRAAKLPTVAPGCPVTVDAASLRIGSDRYLLDAHTWSPRLPTVAALATAKRMAGLWLSDLGATFDIGFSGCEGPPGGALEALRCGNLGEFAAIVGGRGPGLTPAGDDVLAGTLLVARAIRNGSPTARPDVLVRCAYRPPTNDIARAFLVCAARGRCIEPAHELLAALTRADYPAVCSTAGDLRHFGSSSGAALMYGIGTALAELPDSVESWTSTPPKSSAPTQWPL